MSAIRNYTCPFCNENVVVCLENEDDINMNENYKFTCKCGKEVKFNNHEAYDIEPDCPNDAIKLRKI